MLYFQQLLCTVIKFHVVKEAIQRSSSLPFITNFNLFVKVKTSAGYSTYFKDIIHLLLLSIQSGVGLMEVFSDRN